MIYDASLKSFTTQFFDPICQPVNYEPNLPETTERERNDTVSSLSKNSSFL